MIRDTPNFTYEQELACPSCGGMMRKMYAQTRDGRYKRIVHTLKRPEKDGPWGPDDVLEDAVRSVGRYQKRVVGKQWVHKASLMCSRCGLAGSYGNCVRHEFADDELPHDFWAAPEGVYLPEEPPEESAPADPSDGPYDLSDLF